MKFKKKNQDHVDADLLMICGVTLWPTVDSDVALSPLSGVTVLHRLESTSVTHWGSRACVCVCVTSDVPSAVAFTVLPGSLCW